MSFLFYDILEVSRSAFLGIVDAGLLDHTLQKSLMVASAAIGALGIPRFCSGLRHKNIVDLIRGSTQAIFGVGGASLISHMEPKVFSSLHQIATLALASSFVLKLAVEDLKKGKYLSGAGKALLGLGGLMSSAYYAYSEFFHEEIPVKSTRMKRRLAQSELLFLKDHEQEIHEIYEDGCGQSSPGEWVRLGSGASKVVFEHPNLPGKVIKIPRSKQGCYDIEAHQVLSRGADFSGEVSNIESLEEIIKENSLYGILVPETHLHYTSKGPLVVAEKIDTVGLSTEWVEENCSDPKRIFKEMSHLLAKSGLCDVYLNPRINFSHNAGMVEGCYIAILDADCMDLEPNSLAIEILERVKGSRDVLQSVQH